MPLHTTPCEGCKNRWDGTLMSEFPSLRFCHSCYRDIGLAILQMMGAEFIDSLIHSDQRHLVNFLTFGGMYPVSEGGRLVTGYGLNAIDRPEQTSDSSLSSAFTPARCSEESRTSHHSMRPEARPRSNSQLEESAFQATAPDEDAFDSLRGLWHPLRSVSVDGSDWDAERRDSSASLSIDSSYDSDNVS